MVIRFEFWHGQTRMCCGCGDAWYDGDIRVWAREPQWQRRCIAHNKDLWHKAAAGAADPTIEELEAAAGFPPRDPAGG